MRDFPSTVLRLEQLRRRPWGFVPFRSLPLLCCVVTLLLDDPLPVPPQACLVQLVSLLPIQLQQRDHLPHPVLNASPHLGSTPGQGPVGSPLLRASCLPPTLRTWSLRRGSLCLAFGPVSGRARSVLLSFAVGLIQHVSSPLLKLERGDTFRPSSGIVPLFTSNHIRKLAPLWHAVLAGHTPGIPNTPAALGHRWVPSLICGGAPLQACLDVGLLQVALELSVEPHSPQLVRALQAV
mmetsp:Transcript_65825/g.204086  ORF Transcript_65825/g.204086 Transcript_65825/m.204086 type:complete len:237 (+) Transcript_65825:1676-2386(+)